MESKRLRLNKEDLKKIAKGAVIAVAGALLTYSAQVLPSVDFGLYTPFVAALGAIAINAGWKLVREEK